MSEDAADRLLRLLDIALGEMRSGDGESACLVLKEAEETARRMPKKNDVICLPDLTRGAR